MYIVLCTHASAPLRLRVFRIKGTGPEAGHPPSILWPSRGHPVHFRAILGEKATKIVGLEGHPLQPSTPLIILRRRESARYKIYGVQRRF
jgi:hypothetical protein